MSLVKDLVIIIPILAISFFISSSLLKPVAKFKNTTDYTPSQPITTHNLINEDAVDISNLETYQKVGQLLITSIDGEKVNEKEKELKVQIAPENLYLSLFQNASISEV